MFSFLFGSSCCSAANSDEGQDRHRKKRPREEGELAEEELREKRRPALVAEKKTEAAPVVEEEEEEEEEEEQRGAFDDLYMALVKKSDKEQFFRMKVSDLREARAKYSTLFSTNLTSLVNLIKSHVPSEHQKDLKIAEEKLRLFREMASSSIPTLYFKYVSVPFSKELLANQFESIITEAVFMTRIDGILREKTENEEEYGELREKVRGVFGVLLGHIQTLRSASHENEQNEKDWQELCNKLLKLFVISVTIQFIDEIIEEK